MDAGNAIKKAIRTAEESCRKNEGNSYLSSFYAHKKKKLTQILSRLETCVYVELFFDELKQERLHLMHSIKEEELHPTFDWYADHYFETVYTGELAGCEEALSIFESYFQNINDNSPRT